MALYLQLVYVPQQLSDPPAGAPVTAKAQHGAARLAARGVVDGRLPSSMPMITMGARRLNRFLPICPPTRIPDRYQYAMVGYHLRNTLTETPRRARGMNAAGVFKASPTYPNLQRRHRRQIYRGRGCHGSHFAGDATSS